MSSLGRLNQTHTSPSVQPCTLTRSLVLLMVCTGSSVPAGAGSGGTSGGKIGLGGLWDWGVCLSPPLLPGADGPIAPCSWDRKNNPEPWNKLSPTDQYKVSTGWTGGLASVEGGGMATVAFSSGKGPRRCQPWGRLLVLRFGKGTLSPHPLSHPPLPQFLAVSTDYKSLKKERPSF